INDGKRSRIAFDFDLKSLLDQFDIVESLRYQALPEELALEAHRECALIEVTGTLNNGEKPSLITACILSHPPSAVGPGVRILPNGEIEAV
ncbi:MAG: hypothetical protein JKY95_16855, partial [Planctomycetaceae bacterium]|nr:hypothetical protein [Planctomycetaceae bacterium]